MSFKKFDGSTWQSITPKQLKGIPYTGTLPATLTDTKAGYLHRYKIYGNTEQTGTPTPENPITPQECGERTENLWNANKVGRIQVASDASFLRYGIAFSGNAFSFYLISDSTVYYKIKTGDTYETATQLSVNKVYTITLNDNQTLLIYGGNMELVKQAIIQINLGSTALPYEPYGYKLPLTSAGQDVDIYIGDDTLSDEEYVDSGTGKIYRMVSGVLTPVDPPVPFPPIPTSAGSTTISWAGEGLAPSEFDSIQEWVDTPTYTYTNGAWVADN